MTSLQAYLNSEKTKEILSKRPGDEGFSLIELVVVVAVLAILAAIAIPSFTAIQDNAAQAAAKNTIATIAKECAVKRANMETGNTYVFTVPQLNSYTVTPANGTCNGTNQNLILATADAGQTMIPSVISYNVQTGVKACAAGTDDTSNKFCAATGRW